MSELHDRIAEAYQQVVSNDIAYMRSLGLTTTALRSVLNDYENAEISFDKLLNLVRAAARVMADEERTRADNAHAALRAAEQRELNALAALDEALALIRAILDADCLQPHAFEQGDADASLAHQMRALLASHAPLRPPSIIASVLPWLDAHLPRPSPAPLRVADDALPSALSTPLPTRSRPVNLPQ